MYAAGTALALVMAGAVQVPASAATATFYVDSVNGNDAAAGNMPSRAWKTLDKANAAALVPGSKLLLKRGSTWSGQLSISKSGMSSSPIVVDAYGSGARPILSGDTEACLVLGGENIEVYNLQIGVDGDQGRCEWAGIKVSGNDNVIEQNYITGAAAGVYIEEGVQNTSVTSNEFVNNNHMSKLSSDKPNDDSGAFAILVQGDDSNIAWNSFSGSVAFSYDYEWDGAAVEIFLGSRNWVHHNIAVDNDTFTELGTLREDDGTSLDADGTSDNLFEYNAIYGPRTRSGIVTRGPVHEDGRIETNGPVFGTVFRNNSMDLTNPDSEGVVCDASCTNEHFTLSQNIVVAAKKTAYADSTFTANDHNIFYGGQYQMGAGTGNRRTDPKFDTDPSRPLRLRSDSPAIGLGVTPFNGIDLDSVAVGTGGTIEAGAYEYAD
jgi:hypothetical protein